MQKLSIKNSLQTDHKSPAEIELDRLERKLRTLQLALEILTGACATLPEPEPELADDSEDAQDEDEGSVCSLMHGNGY